MSTASRPWLLEGITAEQVTTDRLRTNVLRSAGNPAGSSGERGETAETPVVLIHGNCSSAHLYQQTMQALSGPSIAIDLRGFGDSETAPVDATRGLADFSDDVAATLDALGISGAVVVGWSMGGGVACQLLIDRPDLVGGLLLESPVAPVGFGGTDADGHLLVPSAAGTGGGGANPDFVARLESGDTTDESPTSPRSVFRSSYVAAGYTVQPELEDLWVASMLTTATGPDNYPGDAVETSDWPGFGPGDRGVLNTMAPTHCDLTGIVDVEPKPPVVWVRGAADAIVGDASFFDLNTLGQAGIIPGWPGADVAPPQPMVTATRRVFDRYRAAGGEVTEHVWDGVGHSPHLERVAEFAALVEELRSRVSG